MSKMTTKLLDGAVRYALPVGETFVPLNPWLGKKVSLSFKGEINCVACNRAIKKSFQNGYCFPCTQRLAQCDLCVVKPELCHYDKGTCREPEWGENHCMITHYVYLANSSGAKVGLTRHTQIPYRWIDQGAVEGVPIAKTSSRYIAGLLEVAFKEHVADKTNWRQMLKNEGEVVDLGLKRRELFSLVEEELDALLQSVGEEAIEFLENEEVTKIDYPVLEYPQKIKSLSFDKTPLIEGTLMGIKGQYLILDTGVLNVRKFSGYNIEFNDQ